MANVILTPQKITNEALFVLENMLGVTKYVDRSYESQFAIDGGKIGATLNVRKPAQMVVSSNQALAATDYDEEFVPLVINQYRHVPAEFTNSELTLSLDNFSDRVLKPAMSQLASAVDAHVNSLYTGVANVVQASAGLIYDNTLDAGAVLDDFLAPRDNERTLAVGARQQASVIKDTKSLFQSSTSIADQYENGTMGRQGGFRFSLDTLVPSHTVGPFGGTPAVNGAGQTGATLVTNGWTAAAALRVRAGDVFTVPNVFAVNPVTKVSMGFLQQFVVTANGSSDGAGNLTLAIFPAIVTSGNMQTVSASPTTTNGLTFLGTANAVLRNAMAFHKGAITLATIDQPLPKGVDMAARASSKEAGLSIRLLRQWDNRTNSMTCRFDILFGTVLLRPEHVVRIQTTA